MEEVAIFPFGEVLVDRMPQTIDSYTSCSISRSIFSPYNLQKVDSVRQLHELIIEFRRIRFSLAAELDSVVSCRNGRRYPTI